MNTDFAWLRDTPRLRGSLPPSWIDRPINIYTRSQFGIFAVALFRHSSGSAAGSLPRDAAPPPLPPGGLRLNCCRSTSYGNIYSADERITFGGGNFITVLSGWNLITIKHLPGRVWSAGSLWAAATHRVQDGTDVHGISCKPPSGWNEFGRVCSCHLFAIPRRDSSLN